MLATQTPANTLAATRAFTVRVAHAYPIQQAILFGNRARGTAHDENNADVAAIFIQDLPVLEVIASDLTGYVTNPAYNFVTWYDVRR